MRSPIESKVRSLPHSTRFGGLVAAGRLYRVRRVEALFDSCVQMRRNNGNSPEPRRIFTMVSKLLVVSLCAMLGAATLTLTGCAQFENSFGELRGPVRQSVAPTISQLG